MGLIRRTEEGACKKKLVGEGTAHLVRRHADRGHFEGRMSTCRPSTWSAPLPEERLSLLFDLGSPNQKITIDEMPANMQVCNCNGVTKAALGACVAAGNRTTKAVMDATRAGKGCGSCKNLVAEVVLWFCGGEVEEDPSIHYYVPGVPLTKPQLIAALREQNLKSVSAVFRTLAAGTEDAASKPALASLLASIWNDEYEDERDARFINDRVHGNIQKDGTFSVIPEMPGGVCKPDELMRIAEVAVKYKVPLVKLTGGRESIWLAFRRISCRRCGANSECPLAPLGANGIARARVALARIIAALVSATAWGSPTRSNNGFGGSTARPN